MRIRRVLAVLLLSWCSLTAVVGPVQAHVVKPVKRSDCVFNWKTVGGAEKQTRCFAAHFGISPDFAASVEACESGHRWNAYNPAGPYHGSWQYLSSTFNAALPHYFPGRKADPYHHRYATIVTMRKVAHEGWGAWGCA